MIKLYEHQSAAVENIRAEMRRGQKNILHVAPTGYGKTVVMSYILQSALKKGSTAAIVLPRKELIRQTALTLDEFGIPYSYIASGKPHNPYAKVFLCSLGTFYRRFLNAPDSINIVMVDETHFATSQLSSVINYYKSQNVTILGLTATPWRSDGQGLGVFYDTMVEAPQVSELIEMGYLSDYKIFAPKVGDLQNIRITAGDFNKKDLQDVYGQNRVIIGDAIRHWRKCARDLLTIAYCVSVKHAEDVAATFRASGIPAASIDGTMKDDERKYLINSFANGDLKVLTNCDLLTFGFDLASQVGRDVVVEAMVDLRPTQSLSLQMQKWGRALRKKPNPAIILDHAGNADRHGLPCEIREWTLDSRKRKGRQSGGKISQCEECFFVYDPKESDHCPECGAVPEKRAASGGEGVEEVDGELVEIDAKEKRRIRLAEQAKCRTLDELIELGKSRGYKNPAYWASQIVNHRMRGRA